MAQNAARLSRIFTPEYVRRINMQLVHPAQSQLVKPHELESALARPLHVSTYEPRRSVAYLAATLAFGIIKGSTYLSWGLHATSQARHAYASVQDTHF